MSNNTEGWLKAVLKEWVALSPWWRRLFSGFYAVYVEKVHLIETAVINRLMTEKGLSIGEYMIKYSYEHSALSTFTGVIRGKRITVRKYGNGSVEGWLDGEMLFEKQSMALYLKINSCAIDAKTVERETMREIAIDSVLGPIVAHIKKEREQSEVLRVAKLRADQEKSASEMEERRKRRANALKQILE